MTNCRVDICHCHSTYAAVGLQFPVIVLEKKRPTEARSLFLCLIDQRITVVLYLFNQLVNSVIFLSSLLQVISKVLVHLNPSTPLSVKDRTSPKNIKYNIKHTNIEI